jgi:uncharacterized PurR-regulated membrane protein YhhQ (DUF165 family)
MYIASLFIYSDIIASVALNDFVGVQLTSGSAGLFVMSLLALVWVIEVMGTEEARKYVYGIIFSKLLIIIAMSFFLLKTAYALSNASPISRDEIFLVFGMQPRVVFASVLAFIVDMFLLAFLYTYFKLKYPLSKKEKHILFIHAFVPLLITLYVDSLIFVTIAFLGNQYYLETIYGHIIGKSYIAVLFSLIFALTYDYLPFDKKEDRIKGKRYKII